MDFHDFDSFQDRFTAEEIELKIKTYLEKDPSIQRFYQLNSDTLTIGDSDQQRNDYILHLTSNFSEPICKLVYTCLDKIRIAIDPGHFGGQYAQLEERYVEISAEKTRNCRPIQLQEGDLTYLTALELKRLLEAEGAMVMISRPGIGKGAIKEDFFEWVDHQPNLNFENSSPSKLFRETYNRADLLERAKKINAFNPDLTIIIHYNSDLTRQQNDAGNYFTKNNYCLAFIPGAFCDDELKSVNDRYEFLRLLVTDDVKRSQRLSEQITTQFVDQLHVPLSWGKENDTYVDRFCIKQKNGIYSRNLALTRLIHGPLCYGETLIQENEDEVYRLSSLDSSVAGIPCSSRLLEVAQAYFVGIKEYIKNQHQYEDFIASDIEEG